MDFKSPKRYRPSVTIPSAQSVDDCQSGDKEEEEGQVNVVKLLNYDEFKVNH